jgi:hypothetical protein
VSMVRRGVTRVVLGCTLCVACPAAVTTAYLRPAFVVLAYVLGAAGVVVPAHLLVRTKPPLHRCPPRHARHGHVGVDTDTRLKVAAIQRRLDSEDRMWRLAEFLRRGGGQHKRDFHVIHGGGEGDDPENGDSAASLASLPAAV